MFGVDSDDELNELLIRCDAENEDEEDGTESQDEDVPAIESYVFDFSECFEMKTRKERKKSYLEHHARWGTNPQDLRVGSNTRLGLITERSNTHTHTHTHTHIQNTRPGTTRRFMSLYLR